MLTERHNSLATGMLDVYLRWAFRRYFQSVRVDGVHGFAGLLASSVERPLVLFGNHFSWWDGFFVFMLGRRMGLNMRIIMEEENLRRYPFFRYTGAFGVNLADERSRAQSLLHAVRFLRDEAQGPRALIIYPHGRLVSPLESSWPPFRPGLESLLRLCPQAVAVPVAHEIVPGQHPRTDVFIEVGQALQAKDTPALSQLEQALTLTHTRLKAKALQGPSPEAFYLRRPKEGLPKRVPMPKAEPTWTLRERHSASSAAATWAKP